jgi:hypothetical protein
MVAIELLKEPMEIPYRMVPQRFMTAHSKGWDQHFSEKIHGMFLLPAWTTREHENSKAGFFSKRSA